MNGGEISGNTALLGGGIYKTGDYLERGILNIIAGKIINNTATGSDQWGSGGGIYTEDHTLLSVGLGDGEVVFSGNTAPTLRKIGINDDVYNQKIGNVMLDDLVNVIQKAPAFNNFDINYSGDVYVVTIIKSNFNGAITVTDIGNGNESRILTEVGWAYVPTSAASSITLSAAQASNNEFMQFFIANTDDVFYSPANIPISGNMSITAVFSGAEEEDEDEAPGSGGTEGPGEPGTGPGGSAWFEHGGGRQCRLRSR
jgi:hypothetical protein